MTKYKIRAVHTKPEFLPIVEECPTAAATAIRAGRLYLIGYVVEVTPPLPCDFIEDAALKDAYGLKLDEPLPPDAKDPPA